MACGAPVKRSGLWDPERGDVSVDASETYDAAAQVTRGTWFFSDESEPDYVVAPLELRSVFPYRTTSGGESRLQPGASWLGAAEEGPGQAGRVATRTPILSMRCSGLSNSSAQ